MVLGRIPPRDLFMLLTYAFWFSINVPTWPWFGRSIATLVLSWLVNDTFQGIFPITISAAVLTFLLAYTILKRAGMTAVKAVLLAGSLPFAFTGVFELVYQNLFFFFRPNLFTTDIPGEVLMSSWVLLGLTTFPYWRVTKAALVALTITIACFAAWLYTGYPQIYEPGGTALPAFIMNASAKIGLASVFLLLFYGGRRSLARTFERRSRLNMEKMTSR